MRRAADRLLTLGVKVAVVKGGHLDAGNTVSDVVATEAGGFILSRVRASRRGTPTAPVARSRLLPSPRVSRRI